MLPKRRSDALEVLEGKRNGCLLGEPTRRRPVLPGPALPRRLAVRRRTSTRPRYVQVSDSTSKYERITSYKNQTFRIRNKNISLAKQGGD